ncbi:MAG: hypothetical protein PVG39_20875 [Desulfobacteraceae bacterium]|jgi:hypothetical protein
MAEKSTVVFTPYPKVHYAEEYQTTGFQFAFMSKDNKMCHDWIICRDFLQDALRNQLTGRDDEIYSFHYKPGIDPKLETTRTLMLMSKEGADASEFKAMLKSAVKLVNHYETRHKLTPLTKMLKAKSAGEPGRICYLLKGPGAWSKSPVMISLYTFLIRIGYLKLDFKDHKELMAVFKELSSGSGRDHNYLKQTYEKFDLMIKHRSKHNFKKRGYKKGDNIRFQDDSIHNFHHNSGIVKLAQLNVSDKSVNEEFRKIFK